MSGCGYKWQQGFLELFIHVQAGASKEGYDGLHNERIKIRISAPANDNKANKRLISFLSKTFSVAKSSILIKQGLQSRYKTVQIQNPGRLPDWASK